MKVGHSPQVSSTVNGTVIAWPGVARVTTRAKVVVFAGRFTVWPLVTAWPLRVTVAFWNVPNRIDVIRFASRVFSGEAVIVARSAPLLAVDCTTTAGRGEHGTSASSLVIVPVACARTRVAPPVGVVSVT